jgi:Cu/Ag efflux protein CusF
MQMRIAILIAAASLLPLAACGEQASEERSRVAETGQAERTFAGTGEVTALASDSVTIDHGPIAEIGWPAMTMAFKAPPELDMTNVEAGGSVRFAFRKMPGGYELTDIDPMPEDDSEGDRP